MNNFIRGSGNSIEYLIPLTASKDAGEWVSGKNFKEKLLEFDLTPEEWYCKYILGLNEIRRPLCKCTECSNEVKFLGPARGYSEYCSLSCSNKGRWRSSNNSHKFDKFKEKQSTISLDNRELLSELARLRWELGIYDNRIGSPSRRSKKGFVNSRFG